MRKKSFEKLMKKAVRDLVEDIHPEDIGEEELSDEGKLKIEKQIADADRRIT